MRLPLSEHLAAGPRSSRLGPGLFWVLDAAGAVVFALGLAGAVTHLSVGVAGGPWPWLGALLAGAMLRAVSIFAATSAGARRARQLKGFLRETVFRAALRVPAGQAAPIGERAAAVVDEVEALDGWFCRFEPLSFAARISPVLVLGAIALASPISALILVGALIPFALIMALAGMMAADAARAQFEALGRLSGLFIDRVRALPVVLAFQAEAVEAAKVEGAARGVARRTLAVLRFAFLSSAGLEFFAALSVALVAVYAGFNLLGLLPIPVPEKLDLGRALFVLALAPEVYLPLRRLAGAYHDKQAGQAAAERLARLLDGPAVPAAGGEGLPDGPNLAFEEVRLTYPGGATIGPISFTAPAGKVTVLLGASGSGKTSLLSALVGAAPLSAGEVRVDGLRLSSEGSFARSVAWAGQAPALAPGSVADNISLGRPGASAELVAAIADKVGLAAVMAGRAEGLDTRLDERGSGLSGGERRRIGLARAWLKPAPILCLDEPTADLDARAEAEMIEVLASMARGRTVLIASHSEKVAAMADHVVRLP
ncbi:MAG: thiol reductant ABC exporter subunit CydD [Phenylobacterium sp.]|uniref:thiol reductant ABC exporter subunit CydD n=1 Tax=Phenylobacterium sp. TaxID=1871053 RepID=UPI002736D852|nr:thiol reductant ABC exporter subunit CydD [Phenylobacterium sp.]MDP3117794.1 thiol reductant ABC exporter subunit CydD [Phenylobacterium sp.]